MSIASSTIERISEAQKALGAHTGFIGATVLYDVEKTAEISLDDLEKLFEKHKLDKNLLPALPSPRKVFSYVMNRCTAGMGSATAHRISSETTHDVWGVYCLQVTGDDKPVMERGLEAGEPLAKIGFFPENPNNPTEPLVVAAEGKVVTQTPQNEIARSIIADWNHRRSLLTNFNLSEMIRFALKSFARVRLKDSGHVYFVPARHMDSLAKLRNVLSEIGGNGTKMKVIPAANHPDGVVEITSDAKKDFESEISDLREKVSKFTDKTSSSVRDRSVSHALELKSKVELYRDISEGLVEALQGDLDSLVDGVNALMGA